MKNTFILFAITFSAIAAFYYLSGCNDKSTTPPVVNTCTADTTILLTDQFGNVFGGDTTDWCFHDSGGALFYGAYPNPCYKSCTIRFYEPSDDTVMLYILKTCYDTTVYFNAPVIPGYYSTTIFDSTDQYKNTYQRLYFKSKHFSSSQYCRFYGDIKFTE
jgi:hypothetical protein